jgi:ring-1,2-phenylacetyl-CoA epoxidase subunit PaaD
VVDPELPMLTLADLGVLRGVTVDGDGGAVTVSITPTYTGCPAMDAMREDLRAALLAAGFADVRVAVVLDPPWSTDWISADGRRKLAEAGIAPPGPVTPPAGAAPPDVRASQVSSDEHWDAHVPTGMAATEPGAPGSGGMWASQHSHDEHWDAQVAGRSGQSRSPAPRSRALRHRGPVPLTLQPPARRVACPRCGHPNTELISEFSATACKALRRCPECREPFEHVKEI